MNGINNSGDAAYMRRFKRRMVIFVALLGLFSVSLVIHYGRIMLRGSAPLAKAPSSLNERGPILDRNGRLLAMQTRLANISIWRPEVKDPDLLSAELAPLLGLDPKELAERIRTANSDFIYASKKVDQSVYSTIQELRAQGKLRGVGVEAIVGRVYPEQRLASQVIGFVGDDNRGLAGIEYQFQEELAAGPGKAYGDQVFLTIDVNVQHILENIARETFEKNNPESVVLIAADPRSGDILGFVSLPDFNPNDIRSSSPDELENRASMWTYEPGSVFKVFTMASIMELGGANDSSRYLCNGKYEKVLGSGETITIRCMGYHGSVGPRGIITYSCNSGAAYAADAVSDIDFDAKIREFGFGSRTGLPIPGESPGFIRSVDRWSLRSKATIAMGQEVAVSALQVIQAASAIANDGILVKPRIVSSVVASDGSVRRDFPVTSVRRVISANTARLMRSYMVTAASDIGSGRKAGLRDIELAVKTGTAQLIDPLTKAYSETDYVASFIAMLPADQPQLIIYHVIIKPKGSSYHGGQIAAPPVRDAAEALVDYLGITRGRNPSVSHSGTVALPSDNPARIGERMPDLRGYSKRQLLPLLLRDDLHIHISGEGWVRRQSPEPGVPIEQGMSIELELE